MTTEMSELNDGPTSTDSVPGGDYVDRFVGHFDTERRDYPVCPHCGYIHKDVWEWDFGPGVEGQWSGWCDSCGEEMSVTKSVTISYTARKPRSLPGPMEIDAEKNLQKVKINY
jgi:hypothetical protein